MDSQQNGLNYRFANCSYNPASRQLVVGRRRLHLRPQAHTLLLLFLRSPQGVASREEIKQALWGDKFVVEYDAGISACVKQLRRDLQDSPGNPQFIETIPREGYRFVCEVVEWLPADPDGAPPRRLDGTVPAWISIYRWQWALLALIVIGLAVARFAWVPNTAGPAHEMIAVLPFEIYGATDSVEANMLRSAILDDIIKAFAKADPKRLGVISPTSARTLAGHDKTVAEISSEFGVDFVMDGSARRVDRQWVISVSLSRASDQSWVWGNVIEIAPGTTHVSRQIAASLRNNLLPALLPDQSSHPAPLVVRPIPVEANHSE